MPRPPPPLSQTPVCLPRVHFTIEGGGLYVNNTQIIIYPSPTTLPPPFASLS